MARCRQVTTLLNRAVTLATESANGTINDGSQRQALDAEFTAIKAEIDRIGSNTTYNGSAIFAGGGTNFNQIVGDNTGAPAGLATATSGTLAIKTTGGATIYTTKAADTTVGDVINDINSSGTGLVATLNAAGQSGGYRCREPGHVRCQRTRSGRRYGSLQHWWRRQRGLRQHHQLQHHERVPQRFHAGRAAAPSGSHWGSSPATT